MSEFNKKLFNFSKKLLIKLAIFSFIFGFFKKLFNTVQSREFEKNFKDLVHEEEKEIGELLDRKESPKKFINDSLVLLKDYFIPHEGNFHKPKILHTKSLTIIVLAVIAVKMTLVGYLFFVYPNLARMSEIITDNILVMTNQARGENGSGELILDPVLSAAAMAKAEDMIMKSYFAHHSPDGKKPWDFIDRGQYPYLYVGENLAMNFSSAESAHKALMNSESHKKNILNTRYDNVGLAVATGEINGKTTNVLVELFAAKYSPSLAIASEPEPAALPAEEITPPAPETESSVLASEEMIPIDEPEPEPEAIIEKPAVNQLAQGQEEAAVINEVEKITRVDENLPQKITIEKYPAFVLSESGNNPISGFNISPNREIESNAGEIQYYLASSATIKTINIIRYIFISIMVILLIALILKIFIRIKIQHKPVIAQTIAAIIIISGLISVKLHFLEQLAGKIAVL